MMFENTIITSAGVFALAIIPLLVIIGIVWSINALVVGPSSGGISEGRGYLTYIRNATNQVIALGISLASASVALWSFLYTNITWRRVLFGTSILIISTGTVIYQKDILIGINDVHKDVFKPLLRDTVLPVVNALRIIYDSMACFLNAIKNFLRLPIELGFLLVDCSTRSFLEIFIPAVARAALIAVQVATNAFVSFLTSLDVVNPDATNIQLYKVIQASFDALNSDVVGVLDCTCEDLKGVWDVPFSILFNNVLANLTSDTVNVVYQAVRLFPVNIIRAFKRQRPNFDIVFDMLNRMLDGAGEYVDLALTILFNDLVRNKQMSLILPEAGSVTAKLFKILVEVVRTSVDLLFHVDLIFSDENYLNGGSSWPEIRIKALDFTSQLNEFGKQAEDLFGECDNAQLTMTQGSCSHFVSDFFGAASSIGTVVTESTTIVFNVSVHFFTPNINNELNGDRRVRNSLFSDVRPLESMRQQDIVRVRDSTEHAANNISKLVSVIDADLAYSIGNFSLVGYEVVELIYNTIAFIDEFAEQCDAFEDVTKKPFSGIVNRTNAGFFNGGLFVQDLGSDSVDCNYVNPSNYQTVIPYIYGVEGATVVPPVDLSLTCCWGFVVQQLGPIISSILTFVYEIIEITMNLFTSIFIECPPEQASSLHKTIIKNMDLIKSEITDVRDGTACVIGSVFTSVNCPGASYTGSIGASVFVLSDSILAILTIGPDLAILIAEYALGDAPNPNPNDANQGESQWAECYDDDDGDCGLAGVCASCSSGSKEELENAIFLSRVFLTVTAPFAELFYGFEAIAKCLIGSSAGSLFGALGDFMVEFTVNLSEDVALMLVHVIDFIKDLFTGQWKDLWKEILEILDCIGCFLETMFYNVVVRVFGSGGACKMYRAVCFFDKILKEYEKVIHWFRRRNTPSDIFDEFVNDPQMEIITHRMVDEFPLSMCSAVIRDCLYGGDVTNDPFWNENVNATVKETCSEFNAAYMLDCIQSAMFIEKINQRNMFDDDHLLPLNLWDSSSAKLALFMESLLALRHVLGASLSSSFSKEEEKILSGITYTETTNKVQLKALKDKIEEALHKSSIEYFTEQGFTSRLVIQMCSLVRTSILLKSSVHPVLNTGSEKEDWVSVHDITFASDDVSKKVKNFRKYIESNKDKLLDGRSRQSRLMHPSSNSATRVVFHGVDLFMNTLRLVSENRIFENTGGVAEEVSAAFEKHKTVFRKDKENTPPAEDAKSHRRQRSTELSLVPVNASSNYERNEHRPVRNWAHRFLGNWNKLMNTYGIEGLHTVQKRCGPADSACSNIGTAENECPKCKFLYEDVFDVLEQFCFCTVLLKPENLFKISSSAENALEVYKDMPRLKEFTICKEELPTSEREELYELSQEVGLQQGQESLRDVEYGHPFIGRDVLWYMGNMTGIPFMDSVHDVGEYVTNSNTGSSTDTSGGLGNLVDNVLTCDFDALQRCDKGYGEEKTFVIVFSILILSSVITYFFPIPGYTWVFIMFVSFLPVIFFSLAYGVTPICFISFPYPAVPQCVMDRAQVILDDINVDVIPWNKFLPGICNGKIDSKCDFANCPKDVGFVNGIDNMIFIAQSVAPSVTDYLRFSNNALAEDLRSFDIIRTPLDNFNWQDSATDLQKSCNILTILNLVPVLYALAFAFSLITLVAFILYLVIPALYLLFLNIFVYIPIYFFLPPETNKNVQLPN